MTSVFNTAEMWVLAFCASGFAFMSYHIFKTDKKLKAFRANLKPGDYVKIEHNNKFIRAKYVKPHPEDSKLFLFKAVDSDKYLITENHNIYRP